MSEKDVQDHFALLSATGKHRLTEQQQDTINRLMSDFQFELEEDVESTLELPTLRNKNV